jgi:hypothetical protein
MRIGLLWLTCPPWWRQLPPARGSHPEGAEVNPNAWFIELKRRGRYQRLFQCLFWTTLTAWCLGFVAIVSRLLQG